MRDADATTAETKDFYVVNAFAEKPFGGNPAGVFPDAEGLDIGTMQAIARQMNLVETVFVFRSNDDNADFEFRYFMPERELPVAGHPTIAAIAALIADKKIESQSQKSVTIKTGAGNQQVEIQDDEIIMQQPKANFLPVVEDRARVAKVLSIEESDLFPELPVQPIDSGLGHLIVPLRSEAVLMKVRRNIEELKAFCAKLGVMEAQVFAFDLHNQNEIITRNICPREGIEDPACGVGNGALGYYLLEQVFPNAAEIEITARQGEVAHMPSVIHIQGKRYSVGTQVAIAGKGKIMIKGIFYLV